MDVNTFYILCIVSLMAVNRLLFLWDGWWQVRAPFWTVQLLNLAAACALVMWGIPELKQRDLNIFNLVFAGLLVVHIITNNNKLQRTVREARSAGDTDREALEAEILSKMKKDSPPQEEQGG